MKQILQNMATGVTQVADVPAPSVASTGVLIRTTRSLISAGTEGMLVKFGQSSLIGKARAQPDKVRQVLDKMKTDGVLQTLDAVSNKLDQPLPLGYCNVGIVVEAGNGAASFVAGTRVASNGPHAEFAMVPRTLCAAIPENVSDDHAAFTVLGAIALEGIRLVSPQLGETVVVTGLGLIGLLTVQLLRANGCRVLGIDFDRAKLDLARNFGADVVDLSAGEDPVAAAQRFSRDRGVDAVIITASTTSSEPVHQAALMCRKRGKLVLVGVSGLELSRADFYEKELSFQVSCSYGPGRYDRSYEEKGIDYPVGFVRWTAQRNFEAVLDMISQGAVDVGPLISHRFAIESAADAYQLVTGNANALGILIEYPQPSGESPAYTSRSTVRLTSKSDPVAASSARQVSLGFVGSGNYATAVLIPAFRKTGARLGVVASSKGVSGVHAGRKFGFESTTTDAASVILDPSLDAVVVTTRHDSHARFVNAALEAGKHVFVEKPLAVTLDELDRIEEAYASARDGLVLMVGFNRRFAPHVQRMKSLLSSTSAPTVAVVTVNAGAIPAEHWVQDPAVGGGRIIGEACHFVDLLRFLAGSPITGFDATSIGRGHGEGITDDKATITLRFENGSMGTIHYLANGHRSFPKERIEVFGGGRVLQLNNFRSLTRFGWPGLKTMRSWKQDKGQAQCAENFIQAIRSGGRSPIPFDEIMEVSRATIRIAECLR